MLERTPTALGTQAPWERQGGESPTSYGAFTHFRDAGGERQLKATAEAVSKHYSQIRRWATSWNWIDRALAFDNYMLRLDIAERHRAVAEMRRRHARMAAKALDKVMDRLEALTSDELSTEQIIKWLDIATRIERQALEIEPGKTMPLANVNVDIDARQVHVEMNRPELAAYLDRHPERIPEIIPIVQRMLAEGTDILQLEGTDAAAITKDRARDVDSPAAE